MVVVVDCEDEAEDGILRRVRVCGPDGATSLLDRPSRARTGVWSPAVKL